MSELFAVRFPDGTFLNCTPDGPEQYCACHGTIDSFDTYVKAARLLSNAMDWAAIHSNPEQLDTTWPYDPAPYQLWVERLLTARIVTLTVSPG